MSKILKEFKLNWSCEKTTFSKSLEIKGSLELGRIVTAHF